MIWFKEVGDVVYEAARANGSAAFLIPAREAILAGDPAGLLEAFPGGVRLDDPRAGRIEGPEALGRYCEEGRAWLGERESRVSLIATTSDSRRAIGEFNIELTENGRTFVLPVGVVVEPNAAEQSVWIRIYHSQWPLLGHHVVRPPLLEADPNVRESDEVGKYQDGLAAGDAEECVDTYETDGCFREPAGPDYRVCGTADLLDFYRRFFSAGGGIILEHCTVTEDGVRTALEFNAVKWGSHDLPHQAGLAVYERGSSGRIHEARVYDDVEGPVE